MDEPKDYEMPFFKKYRELVDEIEKLPASDQQTKIVNIFRDFYFELSGRLYTVIRLFTKGLGNNAALTAENARLQGELTAMTCNAEKERLEKEGTKTLICKLVLDCERLAQLAENWLEERDANMEPIRLHAKLMGRVDAARAAWEVKHE